MITIKIVADIKNGCRGVCDAKESSVEEIAMMIGLLEKYKQNIQENFNKLADIEYNTGIIDFKEDKKEKKE